MTTTVTVDLDPRDYERLQAEASRRGVSVEQLAGELLRSGVTPQTPNGAERRQRRLDALRRLARTGDGAPSADAVEIVAEGRRELERRTELKPQP